MLNLDLRPILKDDMSRYSLVIAVAKRARDIAEEAAEDHDILTEKTVSMATQEMLHGQYIIREPEEVKG